MKAKPFKYQNVLLYPEYCGLSLEQLQEVSGKTTDIVIASTVHEDENRCFILKGGEEVYYRAKYRLYSNEVGEVNKGSLPPSLVFVSTVGWVLPIICYELMFPEDWFAISRVVDVHMVLHMVGFPMFSEEQREGWVAMHKAISLAYGCPVVCCCGGESGRMNITGVIIDGRESLRTKV